MQLIEYNGHARDRGFGLIVRTGRLTEAVLQDYEGVSPRPGTHERAAVLVVRVSPAFLDAVPPGRACPA